MNLLFKAMRKGKETKTLDGYDKHIHCEGIGEHFISHSTRGIQCSHKNCIVNKTNSMDTRDWLFIRN